MKKIWLSLLLLAAPAFGQWTADSNNNLIPDNSSSKVLIGSSPSDGTSFLVVKNKIAIYGNGHYTSFELKNQSADLAYGLPASHASGCLRNDGGGNLTWASCGGGGGSFGTSITISDDYVVTSDDEAIFFDADSAVIDVTVTLPLASANPGKIVSLTKINSGAHYVFFTPSGPDTIIGNLSPSQFGYGDGLTVQSDGVDKWVQIAFTQSPIFIGAVVTNGYANGVLYVDNSGNLATSNQLVFDGQALSLPPGVLSNPGVRFSSSSGMMEESTNTISLIANSLRTATYTDSTFTFFPDGPSPVVVDYTTGIITAIAIGAAVTSGLPNTVLFVDAAGNLANNNDFSFDVMADVVVIGSVSGTTGLAVNGPSSLFGDVLNVGNASAIANQIIFATDVPAQIVLGSAPGLDNGFLGSGVGGPTSRIASPYFAFLAATNPGGDHLGGGIIGVNGLPSLVEWNEAGDLYFNGLKFPSADGTAGQAIITDAAGVLSFGNVANANYLYDASPVISINGVTRLAYATDGTTGVVDYSRQGYNSGAILSFGTGNVFLKDQLADNTSGFASVDTNTRFLYGSDGTIKKINWADTLDDAAWLNLGYNSSVEKIYFKYAIADNNGGVYAESVNTNTRILSADDGTTKVLDWHTDTTNTSSSAYWFDSANSNRITGDGSGLSGITASAAWGTITGTLSSQTDLQTALTAKAAGAASSTDNAVARYDGTGGKTLQNSSVIIGDNGDITSTVTGASVGLTISNSTQTTDIANFKDNTSIVDQWLDQGRRVTSIDNYTGNSAGWVINAAAPSSPSGAVIPGINLNLSGSLTDTAGTTTGFLISGNNTTANSNGNRRMLSLTSTGALTGSATSAAYIAIFADLNNGAFPTTPSAYNGQGTWVMSVLNRSSTSTAAKGSGGIAARVYAGNTLIGISGMADQGNGSNAKTVGVRGTATTDTTDFSGSYAGVAGLVGVISGTSNTTLHDYLPAVKAAIVADNLASTASQIIALDNGVVDFEVADGGIITLGAASTTPQHIINTATGTTGTDILTMTNGVAGTAGNPAGYLKATINGATRYIPFW